MKLLSLSLALLLLLSYSCYSLEDRLILELQQSKDPYTQNLAKDSTLTNQEKKDIYLNNFYSFNPATNFNTIDQLNTYIDFHDYPYTQQSKYIKNAWLKIIYINPSILDTDNNLLISTTEKSKIYTDYNYTLEFNNTYPNDCRTEHKFTKQTTTQKTYLFENFLCNEKICDFQTKNSSAYNLNKFGKVKTSLNIDIQVEIYHYRTLCTGEGEGEHRTCSCKFSHIEIDTDTITLENQVNIKTEQLPQPPKLIYDQTTKYLYITDTGKINNYQFNFINEENKQTNKTINITNSSYKFIPTFQPYDIVQIKKQGSNQIIFQNIPIIPNDENSNVFSLNNTDCNLTTITPFNIQINQDCNLTILPTHDINLSINTDSNITILTAKFLPNKNLKITFTSTNKQIVVPTNSEGIATINITNQASGTIVAMFDTDLNYSSTKSQINYIKNDPEVITLIIILGIIGIFFVFLKNILLFFIGRLI